MNVPKAPKDACVREAIVVGVPSGAIMSTGKVLLFVMVKEETRAIKKVMIRLGHQCFGNIGCGRGQMVDDTYTFCRVRVSWTDEQSDHGDADEMNV